MRTVVRRVWLRDNDRPRGYVLANFHVVGNTKTGVLSNKDNKVLLGLVSSARESVRYRWEGTVVRADPRLDLALVRILKDTTGRPLENGRFPHLKSSPRRSYNRAAPCGSSAFPRAYGRST